MDFFFFFFFFGCHFGIAETVAQTVLFLFSLLNVSV